MRRHLVIGASGHAQEVAWSLRESLHARGEDCELLFFDDGLPAGPVPGGLGDIVGGLEVVPDHARDASLVLGVGLPRVKRAVVERLAHLDLPWTVVVHPAAVVGPNVRLGEGSYLAAGAIATVNSRIGRFVTVNFHCVVAHDDVVGDFATLHPNAHLSGYVTIGERVEIGTGAVVLPRVSIGDDAVLGAGCVAVRSLGGGTTYVGLPARALVAPAARTHERFAKT